MPSEQVQHDAAASQFVATLGAAMAAANYPVAMVRGVTEQTSRADGLDHQFLALPNYVRVGSPTGEAMYIANPDFDVRYDQSFPLAQLVARAPAGAISREEDMAELEPIRNQRRRFPPWVTVLGYAVQSTGLALILQPTPWSLVGAASLGLLVGALSVRGRRIDAIGYLLPTICSFLVALIVFTFNNHSHVGSTSCARWPHITWLSGASVRVAGFMQIAQLAFGILIAAQVAGIADTNLVTTEINRLGPWAPLLGVMVCGLGAMLYFGPLTSFFAVDTADAAHRIRRPMGGKRRAGSYASGFGGGLTLIMCALAISHRPNTPPTVSPVLPGFWLLVPGSLGFMGVTQLLGTHSTAVFTATLIPMMSIAVGVQTGLLVWRAAIQLSSSPDRRAMHD
ncbi:MAG TPA: threonine/serine exporter family protein [Mycobacterium sp.]|nr:threonine/serine exporter family protein [Mycobacterium sp.]